MLKDTDQLSKEQERDQPQGAQACAADADECSHEESKAVEAILSLLRKSPAKQKDVQPWINAFFDYLSQLPPDARDQSARSFQSSVREGIIGKLGLVLPGASEGKMPADAPAPAQMLQSASKQAAAKQAAEKQTILADKKQAALFIGRQLGRAMAIRVPKGASPEKQLAYISHSVSMMSVLMQALEAECQSVLGKVDGGCFAKKFAAGLRLGLSEEVGQKWFASVFDSTQFACREGARRINWRIAKPSQAQAQLKGKVKRSSQPSTADGSDSHAARKSQASAEGSQQAVRARVTHVVVCNASDWENPEVLEALRHYIRKSQNKSINVAIACSAEELSAWICAGYQPVTVCLIGHGRINVPGMNGMDDVACERANREQQIYIGPFQGTINIVPEQMVNFFAEQEAANPNFFQKVKHLKLVACMSGIVPKRLPREEEGFSYYHKATRGEVGGSKAICAIVRPGISLGELLRMQIPFHPQSLAARVWYGLIKSGVMAPDQDFALTASPKVIQPSEGADHNPHILGSERELYKFTPGREEDPEAMAQGRWLMPASQIFEDAVKDGGNPVEATLRALCEHAKAVTLALHASEVAQRKVQGVTDERMAGLPGSFVCQYHELTGPDALEPVSRDPIDSPVSRSSGYGSKTTSSSS